MATKPDEKERIQFSHPDETGKPTFAWQLTDIKQLDTVKLVLSPMQFLPIIFVPGIMGSNLGNREGKPVWLLDSTIGQPLDLVWDWATRDTGLRQNILHPERTGVYAKGHTPRVNVGQIFSKEQYLARGWGEVGETSYHGFLKWLERKMNESGADPKNWEDFYVDTIGPIPRPGEVTPRAKPSPGMPVQMKGLPVVDEHNNYVKPVAYDELLKRAKYRFPVHAFGYNWLDSNENAAKKLKERILKVIQEYNRGPMKCSQVILITHSMGGLVARRCVQLDGVADKVAGVIHGVMPAVGAAVAYRRCKAGMKDEDYGASLVIGQTGKDVTAVFSQAPGALQLLPSRDYGPNWLQIKEDGAGKVLTSLPKSNPYSEIYLVKDKWWGLINEEWLSPAGGTPTSWTEFENNILVAEEFHDKLSGKYHANTYVFYGASGDKQASFEKIVWTVTKGKMSYVGKPAPIEEVPGFGHHQVQEPGNSQIYGDGGDTGILIPGPDGKPMRVKTHYWSMVCSLQDGIGDGTVPESSGSAPRRSGGGAIRQQFALRGFSHEPAYKDPVAQCVAHYAITKISASAK